MKKNRTTHNFIKLWPQNIFNADEFGLSKKTPNLRVEKCSCGKNSRIRLTGLAAANMTERSFQFLSLGSRENHAVLNT